MKLKALAMAALAAGSLMAEPSWAGRSHYGGYVHVGQGYRGHAAYGHRHYSGHGHYWAPLGLAIGAAVAYSALRPRTVHYEPRVIYSPPIYYSSSTTLVQSYPVAGDPVVIQPYVVPSATQLSVPLPDNASVVPAVGVYNVQAGPGAMSAQWVYVCKNPPGQYPDVTVCPTGWSMAPRNPPPVSAPMPAPAVR